MTPPPLELRFPAYAPNGEPYHVGRRAPAGNIVFIHPDDAHTFAGEGFVQVNVAFEHETVRFLERRYFADADSRGSEGRCRSCTGSIVGNWLG